MASWLALRAAVHDLDLDELGWVGALHTAARALLDEGLGTFVYSYRVDREATIRIGSVAGLASAPGFCQALFAWGGENQRSLARIYGTGLGSLDAAARAATRTALPLSNPQAAFEPHGVADVFTLAGHDPLGFGVFVTVPQRRRVSEPPSTQRRALERLCAELAALARMREHRHRAHSARLSASEQRVAHLLMNGASDKCIASELGVSLSSVSTFALRVRRKLGCRPGEELLLLRPRLRSSSLPRRLALFDRLTSSECDVASALLVGESHGDIAERRGVSVRTVAAQCTAIFRKCGVSGRRELAATLLV
jgi:DNA-binding NarL/FixJ family response regulator